MGYTHRKARIVFGPQQIPPTLTFREGSDAWLKIVQFPAEFGTSRIGFVHPRTIRDYKNSIRSLCKFFGDERLRSITPDSLRKYQELRASGALASPEYKRGRHQRGPGAGAGVINKEIALLIRLLRGCGAWTAEIEDGYMPLMCEESDTQRALTPPQQAHFLSVAASKQSWELIYWFSLFSLNTTMGTGEMRGLWRRDLDLEQRIVTVRPASAKNKYRARTIPLNGDSLRAANMLLDRARQIGSRNPEHFVLPFRIRRNWYDPTRQMSDSGLNKQWIEVRDAADLSWFRPYDLRHTAITRFAEAGTAIQVLMDMAGHVSQKMQAHYTHISQQAKRQAVAMVSLAAAEKKPHKGGIKAAAYAMAEKVDAALAGVTIPSLIKRLQRAGLGADVILGILADEGESGQ